MANITKRPTGYRIRVEIDPDPVTGHRRWQSHTFKGTWTDAKKKATELESQRNQGTLVEPSKLTMREYLQERWLKDYVHTANLKPRTVECYEWAVKTHLLPTFGNLLLQKLAPADLQRFYRQKLEAGLSSTTVRLLHVSLHKALRCAVRWGLVNRNAADAVDPPRRRKADTVTWTNEQVRAFLGRAAEHRLYSLFLTAVLTGARQGELLALRWSDVDFDRSTITIRRTLIKAGADPIFNTPKSESSRRTITISSELASTLRTWKARQNEERLAVAPGYRSDLDLVFCNEIGGTLDRHNLVRRDFDDLIRKADLPRIRFHDLRHYHATMLLTAGASLKAISHRLGHSGIGITANLYAHVEPALQRDLADLAGRVVCGT